MIPDTAYIAKAKVYKKFEFGSKASITVVPIVNIIVGFKNCKLQFNFAAYSFFNNILALNAILNASKEFLRCYKL
jgi:hypothetical protein